MCGGVIFPYKKEYRQALEQFYSPEEVDEFERTGEVRSLYWQRGEPVLPVRVEGTEQDKKPEETVVRWGNRDKNAPFPQTGWARVDSIMAGRWDYLHPEPVLIPVTQGVEKGKWFEIDTGIKGLLVHRDGDKRVYMLTEDANQEFLGKTNHPRMPVLENQTSFSWLEGPAK